MRQSRLNRAAAVVVSAALLLLAACADQPSQERSDPERQTMSAGIARVLDSDEVYDNVRAVVVVAGNETVFERYYDTSPDTQWDLESVTKSVLSTLIGIAVGEGRIRSVDQTLADLLPAYAARMTPDVARTTLRHVLTATGGFAGSLADPALQFMLAKDPVQAVLDGAVRPPGTEFAYSNGGAHLLSAVLVEATGRSVLAYARAKLFDPLGIDTRPAAELLADPSNLDAYNKAGAAWPVDSRGLHLGWGLLKLTPRDLLKLGLLYLHEGSWKGTQVVPAGWVREATTAQTAGKSGPAEDYGYMWWVGTADGDPAYLAWGHGGQMLAVLPKRRLVTVAVTEIPENDPNSVLTYSSLTYLLDAIIAPAFRPDSEE